jgi:two-component system response regulator VicR
MKRILVCEKEEVLLTALEFRLRKHGYEVDRAANGREALEKIKAAEPDLAIIGTEIEGLSGLDLIWELRDTLESKVPIVVIAPLEASEDIMRAYKYGVDDFVTKPFKPIELVLRVRHILEVNS